MENSIKLLALQKIENASRILSVITSQGKKIF